MRYIPWRPRESSLQLLSVLYDFYEKENPGTVRQGFYEVVSRGLLPNSQKTYSKVDRILIRARKAGIIPSGWITDLSRKPVVVQTYRDALHFLKEHSKFYYRDTWSTQENYIVVAIEKESLIPVVQDKTIYYNVPLFPFKGYSSLSLLDDLVDQLNKYANHRLFVLYLGDFDPSGMDISRAMIEGLSERDVSGTIVRLALNENQVKGLELPPMKIKPEDTRSAGFEREYGSDAYELNALPPTELREIVEEGILTYLDLKKFSEECERENREKQKLQSLFEELSTKWDSETGAET